MRLAFMGSPDFAVPTLEALHRAGHEIAAVYCQPPRKAGRGQRLQPCPVHRAADALGLPVHCPARLRGNQQAQAAFAALRLDGAVVVAYGQILPPAMLDAPRLGCLNIHASLLPRWRGAAPIQAAILAGDPSTGVSIMQMDAGLDTGPVLLAEAVPITPTTTAAQLHDTLAALGARLILQVLAAPPAPRRQPADGASYAPKLTRQDGWLDWSRPAEALDRQVRALNPWPGTWTLLGGQVLKVLEARPEPDAGGRPPGIVLDQALRIGCGTGALRLLQVQMAGRAALTAESFLRGHPLPPGQVLGT